ncbi:MAG: TPM domain-containing protein [Candidatus Falkowbacteria bacterium]|nr:TPM domain-containing protein [Candidatus Falkowbacteria bacterium]
MKPLKYLFGLVFALLVFSGVALAYTNPGAPTGYVNDFAGVIADSDKQVLETKLDGFAKGTSNEISIAIIKSLDGDIIEDFAVNLFKDWKIGKKGKDNGVLILVAIDDRKMKIEVGYGLEGALTDTQSAWIINDLMKPAFKDAQYAKGLNDAVDKIMAATKGEYVPSETSSGSSVSDTEIFKMVGFGLWMFFGLVMWIVSVLGRSKSWWLGGVLGGIIGAIVLIATTIATGIIALIILVPLGLLFDYIVSSTYSKSKAQGQIPWWIGGGRGGGFGGGFGGFGGGSSGGGGASGSW